MLVDDLPFDVVEVKLADPQIRPGTLVKADLIERLCTSRSPLATIVAPAGYGKTTLLAKWAEADSRPFGWVTLDSGDDDALVLLRHIAAAIHRAESIDPAVFEALSGAGGSASWTSRVPRIGGALAQLERPLVLVLDDLHAVANPACLDAVAALLGYVPAGSQLAIASREAPELPLARWRSRGLVEEIGVASLRLDEQEAGLLLQAAGVELEPGALTDLAERTEGWPAGLYLAALSMNAGSPSPASAAGFGGDDQFVAEYFRLELLSRLPPAEARFLQYTSVLDRMCGGLCDAVLQTTRSAHTLETLARTNGFMVPLDRQREWYRYHHLFRELLRNELERSEPHAVAALNRRAMDWCIANDLPEAAVRYGRAAGETGTVARLLEILLLPLYFDGRIQTAEEWFGWLGEDDLVQHPALAVYGAWIAVLNGRPDDAPPLLALADGATAAGPLPDGSATIEPWIATLRAHMMRDGVERALADANLALEQLPPGSWWVPGSLRMRGVAHGLLGATDRETEDLRASIAAAEALGAPGDDVPLAQALLALRAAKQSAWGEAAERARAAQAIVDEKGLGDYTSSAVVHAATARVALHEARREDARAALARAHRLRPQLDHGLPWMAVQVGLELTRAHLALGEASAARAVLSETGHVLELRPDLGTLVQETRELGDRVAASSASVGAWAMSLTAAELRLLPYLATHLTFVEIASRLFISRNTAKTEAVAIYRKFGVSSRSQAIARAIEVGLLDSSIYPQPEANFVQEV